MDITRIETGGEASWRGRDRGRGVENYFSEVEDEARNFAPFLGHFEVEARPSRTSVEKMHFNSRTNFSFLYVNRSPNLEFSANL